MKKIGWALLLVGCAAPNPQQRADGYKRALDVAHIACVGVELDYEAPTDRKTIARCAALESVK